MGLATFYRFTGSLTEKILKVLCLISWAVGGILYAYGIYDGIFNTMTFPTGTKLILASWILHLSLRFFSLWVPMAFCLIQWQMKRILVLIGYLTGCVFALLFSFIAFILVLGYTKDDALRQEYLDLVKTELKQNKFPPSVERLIETQHCCSWFGPTDFAPNSLFDIEDKVNNDKDFMDSVAKCYGGTFSVSKQKDGSLEYAPKDKSDTKIPTGCAEILVDTANITANFTFFTAIVIIILTLAIAALYVLTYLQMPTQQVGPGVKDQPSQVLTHSEEQMNPDLDEMEGQLGGPSDTLSANPSAS